ncbi:NADP-aldehyde dehydrogenase [Cylindrobasidium torrendii FP15055 ss-10]|uniref:Aldehyde dehydrogenase n=1 Tax=Cylindrobasidium torrendii FP15055 ss-10 TaxID=1314674 RepID=A0A0D7BAX5_9AGAR|nr:NADP-aldehyde dehydrogenase [Cylindrobasidium torrendii FP15055 ss-10]
MTTATSYTPLSEIPKIHADLNKTFKSGVTRPVAWRQHQLLQLARMVQDNQDAFAEAIFKDIGKPALEARAFEAVECMERAIISAESLPKWLSPEVNPKELSSLPAEAWNLRVYYEPKGVGLIIVPWNFPMISSLQPLIGAISAGCCAAVKISELTPAYGALLARLFPLYLENSAYQVIQGAVPEITETLKLKWDHILYTGNGTIARVIATAAAKHLTPLTLELGGKSPVIIDIGHPDLELVARRTLFGKCVNEGQICVSPDYVLLPNNRNTAILGMLLDGFRRALKSFYPDGEPLKSDSYGRIASRAHFDRICSLLDRTNGLVFGGKRDEENLKIEPTVVFLKSADDALMEGEIFGPILPILQVASLEEACRFVRDGDPPLVLYAFTEDEGMKDFIREKTMSGNICFNDTLSTTASRDIPFGGVGESGYGRQTTRCGFQEFVYQRGTIDIPMAAESSLGARYPPYTEEKVEIMSGVLRTKRIPASSPEGGLQDRV